MLYFLAIAVLVITSFIIGLTLRGLIGCKAKSDSLETLYNILVGAAVLLIYSLRR